MKGIKILFILKHIVFPLLSGVALYLFDYNRSMLIYGWLNRLGAETLFNHLKFFPVSLSGKLPEWVIYSLPDGLWVYALTVTMFMIWKDEPAALQRVIGISLGPVIGIGYEVGQLFGITPGTFCINDLLISALAVILALALSHTQRKEVCKLCGSLG